MRNLVREIRISIRKLLSFRVFTLLELLIVIAIIMTLMALLLPSLTKAKLFTKQIACGNNLKQLGLGLANYNSDYNDYMPLTGYAGVDWSASLLPYINVKYEGIRHYTYATDPGTLYWNSGSVAQPFTCPGACLPSESPYKAGFTPGVYSFSTYVPTFAQTSPNTYSYDSYFGGWMIYNSGPVYRPALKIDPRSAIMSENNYYATSSGGGYKYNFACYINTQTTDSVYYLSNIASPAWNYHGGRNANFLFGDMHVKTYRYNGSYLFQTTYPSTCIPQK